MNKGKAEESEGAWPMDDSEAGKWVPHGDSRRYTGKGEQSNILTDLEHQGE